MTSVLVVAVFVLLGVAFVVAVVDRALVTLAERKASQFAAQPFTHRPHVRLHGTPFLAQVLAGRYRRIEVSGTGLQIGDVSGASLTATLINARLPVGALLAGHARTLPCDRVEGRMLLPYGEVARVTHIPGLTLTFADGHLVAAAALPIPGVQQRARVSGAARVVVVEGIVWLRVQAVTVAGLSLVPAVLARQLLPLLTVPLPLPVRLPYGLRLQQLTPTPLGLEVTGAANDVVLTR